MFPCPLTVEARVRSTVLRSHGFKSRLSPLCSRFRVACAITLKLFSNPKAAIAGAGPCSMRRKIRNPPSFCSQLRRFP